jgi:UDP-GlcNAc:undecaprenyl-phosphate GlcNAc-1-phosphate transferase
VSPQTLSILALAASAVIVYLAAFLATAIARRIGAVDRPNARRVHSGDLPNWGGLAIAFGVLVSMMFFVDLDSKIVGIVIGACIVLAVGLVDGVRPLRASWKFAAQILAVLVVMYFGVRIQSLGSPLSGAYVWMGRWGMIPTALWIVGITNAVNLIDGLDGLASGICAIACGALCVVALGAREDQVALIWAILCGACLGFLKHNFAPARIIMGDGGSYFLGFMIASVAVMGAQKTAAAIAVVVPIVALAVPIVDTAVAFFRRLLRGKSPFVADRGHVHHRFLDMGLSVRATVLTLYLATAVLCAAALLTYRL